MNPRLTHKTPQFHKYAHNPKVIDFINVLFPLLFIPYNKHLLYSLNYFIHENGINISFGFKYSIKNHVL